MNRIQGKAKQLTAVLLAFVLLVALSACATGGNNSGSGLSDMMPAERTDSPYVPNEVQGESFGYAPQASQDQAANTSSAPLQAQVASQGGEVADVGQTGNPTNTTGTVQSGRKITFWASLATDTKNFNADYQAILDMVKQSGGYVASESMTDNSSSSSALGRRTVLSIKIPASGYNSFLDALSDIGNVTSRNTWSDDLTSVYYDTASRIEMLEIRKERLMNYLLEAERAEDIVSFERELSSVLYELDSYQSNIRQLDQLVDYSTIDVTLTELITPETIGPDGEPLGDRASTALALSATGVGRFLQDVVVFLAAAVPVLGLLIVIALLVWLLVIGTRKVIRLYKKSGLGKARQARKDEARRRRYEQNLMRQQQYPQAYQHPQPAYQTVPQTAPEQLSLTDLPAPEGSPLDLDEPEPETSVDK